MPTARKMHQPEASVSAPIGTAGIVERLIAAWRPPTLRGRAAVLWTLVALNAFIGLALFAADGQRINATTHALRYLLNPPKDDSWRPMEMAIDHLRSGPETPVYDEIFFKDKVKLQYPTSSLLVPDMIQRLTGGTWEQTNRILDGWSWLCVLLTGLISWRLFVTSHRQAAGARPAEPPDALVVLWPILALTLLFYPVTQSYMLGQIQTTITLFAAAALLLWRNHRKRTVGVLIGICCAFKPHWAAVLAWGALRREWGMAAAGTATFAALLLAAGLAYGFGNHLNYVSVVSYLSDHGEAYFANQSVNGLMNRLLFNGDNLNWQKFAFPPYNPVVHAATFVSGLAIIGGALLFRRRHPAGTLDLALILLSLTIASPIAWEHHYALLLPVIALLAPICLSLRPLGTWTAAVLIAAYVLASQCLDVVNALAASPLNVLQSYLFFAALAILLLIYLTVARVRRGAAMPTAASLSPAASE